MNRRIFSEKRAFRRALLLGRFVALAALLVVAPFLPYSTCCGDDGVGSDDAARYVLTRNGAISEGRVVDKGNTYSIEFPGGGALSISKLDVAFVGKDLSSVYRFKLSQTRTEDANEILKLADWASRRGMAKDAIQTIEERIARSDDEGERRAFQRKLEELRIAERFRIDGERVKATKTTASAPTVASGVGETQEERELDAWGRALLPSTLEKFSRKANPVLIKRCATAGCHDEFSRAGGYALRGKARGAAQRLALLYNLRETTLYVNFDNLDASALLSHPPLTDANGERRYPFGGDMYSPRDYDNFLSWFETLAKESKLASVAKEYQAQVAESPRLRPGAASRYDVVDRTGKARETGAASAPDEFGASNASEGGFADLFDSNQQTTASAAQGGLANAPASNPDEPIFRQGISRDAAQFARNPYDDPNSPESALRRGGYAPEKTYRDDFDPAIFNDRYHPQGKPGK